jgi:hypothetical protein
LPPRMTLLLDENVHKRVGDVLIARGHEVSYVLDAFLPGTPDDDLLDFARTFGMLIVSHDQRFMARVKQPKKGRQADFALPGFGRIHLLGREAPSQRE